MMIQMGLAALVTIVAGAEAVPGKAVESLGVEGRYVTVNGRPTFLVGQMSYEYSEGRAQGEVREILDVMMVPFGMNLVVSTHGIIYWGAWNNVVNVRRGSEKSLRPQRYAWQRTGGGETTFGGPRFDLERFDPKYFEELSWHLQLLNERGIVPVVGIFSEHALDHPLHWRGHPFHPENNVNGLGLPGRDALPEFFENERALVYQEAYVRKLLDVLQDTYFILAPFGEVNVAPKAYIDRWLRLFDEHEQKTGRNQLVCLSGSRKVLDSFAADPAVDLIDVYCYHDGMYDGAEFNVPGGERGIRVTLEEAWRKYGKPVGKLYFKYGYPYDDAGSSWADPDTGTQGGGPPSAARDALWAAYEAGGFGIYFKMAWARDRGAPLKPDSWSNDIGAFVEATGHAPFVKLGH
ncbi:MAG: hypothetical protein GY851_07655 [bacterium]|nr:hypothetical protein [bacterium]